MYRKSIESTFSPRNIFFSRIVQINANIITQFHLKPDIIAFNVAFVYRDVSTKFSAHFTTKAQPRRTSVMDGTRRSQRAHPPLCPIMCPRSRKAKIFVHPNQPADTHTVHKKLQKTFVEKTHVLNHTLIYFRSISDNDKNKQCIQE